jgi:hypothetical protein
MNDDETTRDADPAWLASILDPPLGDVQPHFMDDDLDADQSDPAPGDVTIANEDLLAQVRTAVRGVRNGNGDEAATIAPPTVAEPDALPAEPQPARWTPPPRLKPADTPVPPALLVEPVRQRARFDRRVIAAIVAAVVAGILVGVAVFGGGDEAPAPSDPSVVSTAPSSTP